MKILKRILIVIAALVAVLLIAALFIPKNYTVVREVVIQKPKQEVFDYVKFLKNQNEFSAWAMMDPNSKKSYTGTDGTPGFTYTWEGNSKVGKGSQTIASVTEGEKINFDLHFIEPMEGLAKAEISTEALSAMETKVKWLVHSGMPYPFNIFRLFMDMDKMIGNDLETGLKNLKVVLEKK